MYIRNAEKKDINGLLKLLSQVLEIHHRGRPDLFRPCAVKYTKEELTVLLSDALRPVFVAVDEDEEVMGYCFCILRCERDNNILTDIKTLYIDDLCVDSAHRKKHVGRALYGHAVDYARSLGCHNVTLNVWALNESALAFYKSLGMTVQKLGMEQIL